MARGKSVTIHLTREETPGDRQPHIQRRPEVIHGLRNLVQNAVDFAAARVWVEASWDETRISLRVVDDGPGFPPQMIGRIGDPFLRARRQTAEAEAPQRPGYEGMGLGLFIAKTLLERSGARISFGNGTTPGVKPLAHPDRSGAVVDIHWSRSQIEAPIAAGLGKNPPLQG